VACAKLKEADSKPELSELTKTILHNYAEYHICAIRLDAWNEWYIEQKKLFEALK
jgi:alpha-L-arabinofuranosidase